MHRHGRWLGTRQQRPHLDLLVAAAGEDGCPIVLPSRTQNRLVMRHWNLGRTADISTAFIDLPAPYLVVPRRRHQVIGLWTETQAWDRIAGSLSHLMEGGGERKEQRKNAHFLLFYFHYWRSDPWQLHMYKNCILEILDPPIISHFSPKFWKISL